MYTYERRILQTTCYGHFMSHFNMLVFPAVVLPLTHRWQADMAGVLDTSFWMYLFFGLTALPWGLAADRWGAKPLLLLFYGGAGLGGIAAALFIDSPPFFSVALASIGLFSGIYHPAGLGLISKASQRVGYAMGINGMFGNLGLATAPLITGLVNWLWGPQSAYLLLGIMNLTGVAIIFRLPPLDSPPAAVSTPSPSNGMLKVFLILLVAMMLGGIVYRGTTVILPAFFELKNQSIFQWLTAAGGGGVSENLVATVTASFIFLVGMLGQYTGGRLAERFDPRYGYLAFHALTVPLAVLLATAGNVVLILLAVAYFFFLLGMQPMENTLVAQYTPKRLHHSAFGTKFVLTFGVGALAVKMVGFIEQSTDINAVFPSMGLVSLLLVGVIVVLIRKTSTTSSVGIDGRQALSN